MELHVGSGKHMQAHGPACNWNILYTFWNFLHAFWNILEHSACIFEHSGTFWNILEHSGTFCMHFVCFLEHSETFLMLQKNVGRQIFRLTTDGQTDGRTDIHQDLLGCVFAAKNEIFFSTFFCALNLGLGASVSRSWFALLIFLRDFSQLSTIDLYCLSGLLVRYLKTYCKLLKYIMYIMYVYYEQLKILLMKQICTTHTNQHE